MKKLRGAAITAAALLVTGCASAAPSTPTAMVTVTETSTPAPSPSTTSTPAETESVDAAPAGAYIFSAVSAFPEVVGATETEPGRWGIETSITDPRSGEGSPEAMTAIAICETAVEAGANYVSVFEADGTTYVVYGHPSYGNTCTEV